jgi:hypothetical protein
MVVVSNHSPTVALPESRQDLGKRDNVAYVITRSPSSPDMITRNPR